MTGDSSTAPGDLTAALLDAIALFRELKIRYALVGGLAAMLYGRARYTEDVDFVAQPDHESILASHPDVMERHGFDHECTWKLYHRSGIEIDLWKDKHAADTVDRARRKKIAGRFAKVAEVHDLIAMKLRAGRPQDDYDITEILKAQTIDLTHLTTLITKTQLRQFERLQKRIA
ncbi:MAG: nucleotidyltransferase [Planctomycetota bacterium]